MVILLGANGSANRCYSTTSGSLYFLFFFIYDYIADKITSLSYPLICIALCRPSFMLLLLISRNYGPFPNIRIAYHCLGSLLVIVPLLQFMTHPSYQLSGL